MKRLIPIAKFIVAAGLIAWLVRSERLDFGHLGDLLAYPWFLVVTVLIWALATVILGGLRWHLLLKGIGYQLPFRQTLKLHLIGLFFNTAMPGAVGGDLVKVAYVIGKNGEKGKTPALVTVLLDRIIGLGGLFILGSVIVLINPSLTFGSPQVRLLTLGILGATGALVLMYLLGMKGPGMDHPWLARLMRIEIVKKIATAFSVYREHSNVILACLGLSVALQLVLMLYFYGITMMLAAGEVPFAKIAAVFPLGILATAVPLAPGGLGVGHVVFEKLFHSVHLEGGANAFNIYALCTLGMNMVGAIPYLLSKGQSKASNGKSL
jgi:uncharacterized membrane protein YbhN (UPF0104 family)